MRKSLLLVAIAATSGVSSHAAVVHHVIAAQGDPPPGRGTCNRAFYDPHVNSHGQVAFRGGIDGGPTEEGIFRYDGMVGATLALPGDAARSVPDANITAPKKVRILWRFPEPQRPFLRTVLKDCT